MFDFLLSRAEGNCEGVSRRDFVRVGTLGMGAATLPQLFQARAAAAAAGKTTKQNSVVWLWLGGGPTHVETFDPKMTAPAEYRSTTGEVKSTIAGVTLGGTYPKMAQVADKMTFVRSFAHQNSGHSGGTHWVMTGYNHPPADQGEPQIRPAIGSILARARGTNDRKTGVPTYVRLNGIYADGPSFLGTAYAPFDSNGQARQNMQLAIPQGRFDDRRALLKDLDRLNRNIDQTGLMEGLGRFEQQAYDIVLRNAAKAFDLNKEDPRVKERYGLTGLGQQMLLARRLCEAGCGFVTIHYGGWDMHGQVKQSMESRAPEMDQAVAAFVEDLSQRGQLDDTLLVITGEFGRTPRINGGAGRDHWAPLSTLALAGGGLKMGQVVGESSAKVEVPKSNPIGPQDLMATVFHVLDLDRRIQYTNPAGRPVYMIEHGDPIKELVG